MENVYAKIENEMRLKSAEDENYRVINEAKLRAIKEAKNYEDFKKTVETAHLKAIKKDDNIDKKNRNQTWNKFSSNFKHQNTNFEITNHAKSLIDITEVNEQEIIRFWRRANNKERFEALLKAYKHSVIEFWLQTLEMSEIFKALSLFKEEEEDEEAAIVFKILQNYGKVIDFPLKLKMLSSDEKDTAKELAFRVEQKVSKKLSMYSSLWHS